MTDNQAEPHITENAPNVKPQMKYDWYQSDTQVVVTILIKNVDPEKLVIEYETHSLLVRADDERELLLKLSNPINPSGCTYRLTPVKIEVKLAKAIGVRWDTLIAEVPEQPAPAKGPRNWDRVVKEIGEEEPQGEAALNAMFQKIYGESSEEVRRAMNKSFQESGGTVLSTNWKEVGKETVQVRPPDGVEYKKWDE